MKLWWVHFPNGVSGYVQANDEQAAFDAAQWHWGRMPESVAPMTLSEMAEVL